MDLDAIIDDTLPVLSHVLQVVIIVLDPLRFRLCFLVQSLVASIPVKVLFLDDLVWNNELARDLSKEGEVVAFCEANHPSKDVIWW